MKISQLVSAASKSCLLKKLWLYWELVPNQNGTQTKQSVPCWSMAIESFPFTPY